MKQFIAIICFLLPCLLSAQIRPMEACIELKDNGQKMQPYLTVKDQTAHYEFDSYALSGDTIELSIHSNYGKVYLIMTDGKESPVVRLIMGGGSTDRLVKNIVLNEVTGTEFYCLLFSQEPIDVQKMKSALSESTLSNIHVQIQTALGEKVAVLGADVRFAENNIGFSCKESSQIVQINMRVEHE